MNGYTLASTFRHGDLVCAALVTVTGYGRAEDVSRSRRAGVDHHLVKPVVTMVLFQMVASPNEGSAIVDSTHSKIATQAFKERATGVNVARIASTTVRMATTTVTVFWTGV